MLLLSSLSSLSSLYTMVMVGISVSFWNIILTINCILYISGFMSPDTFIFIKFNDFVNMSLCQAISYKSLDGYLFLNVFLSTILFLC